MEITEQIQNKLNEAVKSILEGYHENNKLSEDGIELLQDFIDTYGLDNKMLYVENGFVWCQNELTDEWHLDIMNEDEAKDAGYEFYPLSDYITMDDMIDTEEIISLVDRLNPYDARISY